MLNKANEFRELYNVLLEGGSFTWFIGGVRIDYTSTSNEVKVNNGEDIIFTISDENPVYKICGDIIDIASNEKYFVDQEFVKEIGELVNVQSQNSEESIFEIRGVPIHWIPNAKELVVLSDKYLSVKFDLYNYGNLAEKDIACAIKNIELKRENPDYVRRENLVREKRTQFFEKLTEFESGPKDTTVLIMERKDLSPDVVLLVLADKDFHEFSIVTFSGETMLRASKRYYNNPSTINFLAWDYVSCSEL